MHFFLRVFVGLIRRFPVILSLLALVMAGLLTAQIHSDRLPPPVWWAVHGVLAAILGVVVGLPRWWLPFQLLAPTALALLLLTGLPAWTWLMVLIALVLLYGGGVATRVPLYLSNRAACEALADLLSELSANRPDPPVAIDLGAGFGGPMRYLANCYPTGRFTSVEASPVTWLVAWLLALPQRNVAVRWGDLWAADLGACDLVYVFLSPEPMPRLWERFVATARPGSLLVSNTFPVPGIDAEREIDLPGRADARLFVYRHP